jgi:hypothetical protein
MFELEVRSGESDVEERRCNNDGWLGFAGSCLSGASRFQHPNYALPLSGIDDAALLSSFWPLFLKTRGG